MGLNLFFAVRRECMAALSRLQSMDAAQLERVFEKVVISLLRLMQDSHRRLKTTKGMMHRQGERSVE